MRRSLTLTPLTLLATGGLLAGLVGPASAAHEELTVTGLTVSGRLVTFSANDPSEPTSAQARISGIAAGSKLVAIDYRPATNGLYGVAADGTQGQLYSITGTRAAAVGAPFALAGTVSIDFNPTVDRLRIVSTDGTNLRVNPDTGAVIVDGRLAYSDENAGTAPAVVGVAYTNNDTDAATGTMLFDLEAALGLLAQQVDANAGRLEDRFDLRPRFGDRSGFDIYTEGTTNVGLVSIFDKGRTTLYTLNVSTGTLTPAGQTTGNSSTVRTRPPVVDIAIPTAQ